MILNQPGQVFTLGASFVYIGQAITANDKSIYSGLSGVITEIRDGEDFETENLSVDIYCDFSLPDNDVSRTELETRFQMPASEIPLSHVIMAPEMIDPKPQCPSSTVETHLYVLTTCVDTGLDYSSGIFGVSCNVELLKCKIREDIEYEIRKNEFSLNDHIITEESYDPDENDGTVYAWKAENDGGYISYMITRTPFFVIETTEKDGAVPC